MGPAPARSVGAAGIGEIGRGGADGFVHATLLMAAAHSALDGVAGATADFGPPPAAPQAADALPRPSASSS